ncbi:MAG: RimK/LysX family protein, partial [Gammaproteobacteria bacterium]
FVIESNILIGNATWPIELTLTNRDTMRFRMLLGRRAMENRVVIDPATCYLNGKLYPRKLYQL